ncbi:hypothetical protein [Kribbella sp. NPDC051718]|uniref:hypothetical protein n=1 Tax=Kribbella sp. NPDC051718 TaxID=3155168 RepID=UPI00341E4FBF
MPPTSPNLDGLPEPRELHARFSAEYPLDWGEPLWTTAQIAAEYGVRATRRALLQLEGIGWRNAAATKELLGSVADGAKLYQLERRIKSPQSLARKLKKQIGGNRREPSIEDLQRYTMMTGDHLRLVDLLKETAARLQDRGWELQRIRNSYVPGSRYKGIHLDTHDPRGQRIEVQVHSAASLAVKEATTKPYEVERDERRSKPERELARGECIRLSESLPTPPGLDRLVELGGCPVTVRGYGLDRNPDRPNATTSPHQSSDRRQGVVRRADRKGQEL